MKILDDIENLLKESAREKQVKEVRIGLGYTGVLLEDSGLGVAYTFPQQSSRGCRVLRGLRPVAPRPAQDLLALLHSEDPVEAAVGLATANALANRKKSQFKPADVLGDLHLGPEDRLGMVGMFSPLLPEIRRSKAELIIFDLETDKSEDEKIHPAEKAFEILPECNKVLITATSLLNQTLPGLLQLLENKNRDVVLLGASTPLIPEAFQDTPVTILSGVIALENQKILDILSWAGGMQQFKHYVQKVNAILD